MLNNIHFDSYDNNKYKKFSNPSQVERDLQILVGIIQGIESDLTVNSIEHKELINWINSKKDYENKQPYKEIIQLIREALDDNILTKEESENIIWFCNHYINKSDYFDSITLGIQKLTGIIKGISIDNEVNISELEYLDNWLEENHYLKNSYPYDELYNLVTNIIKDKIITKEEHEDFLKFTNLYCKIQNKIK